MPHDHELLFPSYERFVHFHAKRLQRYYNFSRNPNFCLLQHHFYAKFLNHCHVRLANARNRCVWQIQPSSGMDVAGSTPLYGHQELAKQAYLCATAATRGTDMSRSARQNDEPDFAHCDSCSACPQHPPLSWHPTPALPATPLPNRHRTSHAVCLLHRQTMPTIVQPAPRANRTHPPRHKKRLENNSSHLRTTRVRATRALPYLPFYSYVAMLRRYFHATDRCAHQPAIWFLMRFTLLPSITSLARLRLSTSNA